MRVGGSDGAAAVRGATAAAGRLTDGGRRMSSGLRIGSAADDAAGLVVSEQLRAEIGGLRAAGRNVQDAVSMTQVADGALGEATDVLQRMRELAMSASGSMSDGTAEQAEFDQLNARLDELGVRTTFGGDAVFGAGPTPVQTAGDGGDVVQLDAGDLSSASTGTAALDLTADAGGALGAIDAALEGVTQQRAELGATSNRFASAARGIGTSTENLLASESRVRDADMAFEALTRSRDQILLQSSMAMAAQSNGSRAAVLSLLA